MDESGEQLPLLAGFTPVPAGDRIAPIPLGESTIWVGTCGYSYREWVGPFYPPATTSGAMLAAYARRFALVEIDATYYRIPGIATFESMAARTPEGFRFTAKVPGSLTHLDANVLEPSFDDATRFLESIEPLRYAGKLHAGLAQFPNGFRPNERARRHLARLREAFGEVPLAVEFRHREWQTAATLALLAELDLAWVNVDEPSFPTLLHPSSDVVTSLAYVRFHGRNAGSWWKGDAAERYAYGYSDEELLPWVGRVAEMSERARDVYVLFNNHRFGAAPRDAARFAELLRG